jgi:transposase
MERGKVKRFDKEFKISAVKMFTEGGHSASEVANSWGIDRRVLYNWKKKYAEYRKKAFAGERPLNRTSHIA